MRTVRRGRRVLREGPATTGCEIAIFDVSQYMGPRERAPGTCAATTPRMVSREVVLMSCGLGRARRRRAAATEAAMMGRWLLVIVAPRQVLPLLASRGHCAGGKTPIENLLRQISPRGVMKKLTQPIRVQWATRGGVVVARVPSMHAV